jgi:hypothetical protein
MEVEGVRSVVATYISFTALNVLNKLNTAEPAANRRGRGKSEKT